MKRILLRMLGRVCLTLTATYLLICLVLFFIQRSLIYFPVPTQATSVDKMTLQLAEASIQVSVRPHESGRALIYFGGNAEDVSQALAPFSQAFPDYALYMLHYRGYGGSSSEPTETALHADAKALFEKVYAEHKTIIVVGRSLGSGVAVRLAATQPVHRLILITPYDSMETVAKVRFPFLPISLLLQDTFDSARYAPLIRVPTLLLMAENDELIPRHSTLALFNAFSPGVARLESIARVGHNSISQHPGYMAILQGN